MENPNIQKIIESLSPNERKILPHLGELELTEISKRAQLDKVSTLRALEFLQNKELIKIDTEKKKVVHLGVNGSYYKKKGLPERRLLNLLNERRIIPLEEAKKLSELSEEEFKASIGALKKKAMIEIKNEKMFLNANKEEISKKSLEEIFIEKLPLEYDSLNPEQLYSLKSLQGRKDIITIEEEKTIKIKITDSGKEFINSSVKFKHEELIEQLTPEILRDEKLWKSKKFRRYDVTSPLPELNSAGKRHFVNQSLDYARKIWTDLGFKEMSGDLVDSSFWIFDALFTAQDHPAREMQDTFFINKKTDLKEVDKKTLEKVKQAHEKGVNGSKGWQYKWSEEEAKKLALRTHTTSLSSRTLAELKQENLPAKFFALGKCFRNETVDWSHGFEFYQTEGIVIDQNVNLRNLLGYLKEFYKKMGYKKIRFRPSFFAYTEPSVEIEVWHPEKKIWIELGGAGIFRPEVTEPLLGKPIPVLAWGQGFDRIIMDYYEIKDLREMYKNDITQLRKMKFWMK